MGARGEALAEGAPPLGARWRGGLPQEQESAQARVAWALRRALYGLDTAASSPWYQCMGLLCLAVAITTAGGRLMEATHNHMHTNEAGDTSYGVRTSERGGAPQPQNAKSAKALRAILTRSHAAAPGGVSGGRLAGVDSVCGPGVHTLRRRRVRDGLTLVA